MTSPLAVQNLFNVNGLVAVITGGGSGLGLYAAKALDANGAKAVYIVGRREEVLKEAAKQGTNGSIKPLVGDVTNQESLSKVADTVRQEQGYVNFLFCNAGITGPKKDHLFPKKGEKPSLKDFQQAMLKPSRDEFSSAYHINCTAVFYTAVTFIDLLDAGNQKGNLPQRSQVLVTSSIAGFSRVPAAGFPYSTSKAAVTHLVKMLSHYWGDYHIRVNLVAPGLYPSEMTTENMSSLEKRDASAGGAFEGAYTMPKTASPEERTGSEQDFAGAILFMASQAGAYLNGESLATDGGRLSQLPATY